jgi:hypothetical protein
MHSSNKGKALQVPTGLREEDTSAVENLTLHKYFEKMSNNGGANSSCRQKAGNISVGLLDAEKKIDFYKQGIETSSLKPHKDKQQTDLSKSKSASKPSKINKVKSGNIDAQDTSARVPSSS